MKDFLMWMAEVWYRHPVFKMAQVIAIGMGIIGFLGLLTGVSSAAAFFGCYSIVIFIFIYTPGLIHDSVIRSEQKIEFKIPQKVQDKLERIDYIRPNYGMDFWKYRYGSSDVISTKTVEWQYNKEIPVTREYCSPRWFFRCFIEQEFFKCPFNIMDFPYDFDDMIKSWDRYDEKWLIPIAYLLKKGERYNWNPIGDGNCCMRIHEKNYDFDYASGTLKPKYENHNYWFYFDKKYIYNVANKYVVKL